MLRVLYVASATWFVALGMPFLNVALSCDENYFLKQFCLYYHRNLATSFNPFLPLHLKTRSKFYNKQMVLY